MADKEVPDSFVPDELPGSFIPDDVPASFVPDDVPTSFVPDAVNIGIGQRFKQVALKAITPIPAIQRIKDTAGETAAGLLEAARPEILKAPDSISPLVQALAAARSSIIPLPSPEMGRAVVEFGAPAAPLDIAGTLLSTALSPLMRMLGPAKTAEKVAEAAAKMTPEQTVGHLAELARASKGPEPLIKVVKASTPKETITNLLEREARPRLSSEQALIGLEQTTSATQALADDAIKNIRAGKPIVPKQGQQISEAVAVAVRNGELTPMDAAKLLGMEVSRGLDPAEMARNILTIKTGLGRGLAQFSRIAREYKHLFDKNPEVQKLLKDVPEPDAWTRVTDAYRYVDNLRRALMVSQISTSARNLITQTGRYSLQMLEEAASGLMGAATGKVPGRTAFDDAATSLVSAIRVLGRGGREQLDNLLQKFPVEQAKLMRTPIGDISIDQKVAGFLNTFNTMQETFFRRAAFDARLRQNLTRRGVGITEIDKIAGTDVADAVDHALELTFSKAPTSGPGKAVLQLYRDIPFLTALGNPFPRFWLNAMRFIYEFSPVPLLSPSTYAAMASKDPRIAFKALNRSALGTTMVGAGFALDQAGHTGEKWFEVKIGDKQYDTRPFGPYTGPLFAGRMLSRVLREGEGALLKLSTNDWSQAFLSMRRTDLTGIPVLDAIDRGNIDGFKDGMLRFFGEYLGSFTVPGRTAMDIVGQFSREERLPRNVRERPFLGPTLNNIPFLQRQLPIRPSPFRAEPEERSQPLLRQVSGLAFKQKTPAEIEADRLALKPGDIYPRTGSKEFDRLIIGRMGPLLEDALAKMMNSKGYLQSNDKFKKQYFRTIVGEFRRASKDIVRGERPDLAMQEVVKQSDEYIREEIEKALKQ